MTPNPGNRIGLPPPSEDGRCSVEQALRRRRSVRDFERRAVTLAQASQLLWAAQGVTGADDYRSAPSAGALFPLEVYLVAGAVEELEAGVYRFDPRRHEIALVVAGDHRRALGGGAIRRAWIATAPAILVIAAVHARTERKYGERAARYVLIEVGHAAENVCLQAVALGLGTTVVGAFHDAEVKRLVAMGDDEAPLCLVPVGWPASS